MIHKSIKKIGFKIWVKLGGKSEFHTTVRDTSTLSTLLAMLEQLKEKVLAAKAVELSGHVISIFGPKTITRKSRSRGGKHRENEGDYKALVTALFGEQPGHMAKGAWTAQASDVMRRQPNYLTRFNSERNLVNKVLGDVRYFVTPCTFLCPFESDACIQGVRRLNRFGGISQMYKHWQAKHADNPAAKALVTRFKTILNRKNLTVPQLDAIAPLEQLKEEGYEQRRSLDTVATEDMFSYSFGMNSDGHLQWLNAAGTL